MKITNIRYGPIRDDHGTIQFECDDVTCTIAEPPDVLLVGTNDDAAAAWIIHRYRFLLQGEN